MIYYVRHGQTDDNINGNLLTGWNDVPLNNEGLKQAEVAANALKDMHFDICFCSPLLRTKQTLDQILKYHPNLKVVFDDRLKERDWGEITGQPASVCKFRRWNANDISPFKIESIAEMFDRVASFYEDIKKYSGKNILIVAHSGVARITYHYFYGKPVDGDYSVFKLDNAQVLKIDF